MTVRKLSCLALLSVLGTASLGALGPAPAVADECDPWPGEPVPLPRRDSRDPIAARWAELRSQELSQRAGALERGATVESHLLWRRVLCLDPASQTRLLDAVDGARSNGARVVFDSNYRPRGWPEAATARRSIEDFYRRTDIALPTLEDEQMLFDYPSAEALIDSLIACGVGECTVKDSARPCVIYSGDKTERIDVEPAFEVVDTTAAGDAFNAAYLVYRLRGTAPAEAARAGIKLATVVIRHRGAVIPAEAMPEFD